MLNRALWVAAIGFLWNRAFLVTSAWVKTSITCAFRYYYMFHSGASTASGLSPLFSTKDITTLKFSQVEVSHFERFSHLDFSYLDFQSH